MAYDKVVKVAVAEAGTETAFRANLLRLYPEYRIAICAENDGSYIAGLRYAKIHHALRRRADEEGDDEAGDDNESAPKKPFPIKEMGPDGSEDDSEDKGDEDKGEKKDKGESKESPEEKGAEKDDIASVIVKLKALLPALEKAVGLGADDGGLGEGVPGAHEHAGPPAAPPPGPPAGPPAAGPSGPPAGPPAGLGPGGPARPPRRPGIPGGRPRTGPPGGGALPTFTHRAASGRFKERTSQFVETAADVPEATARRDLLSQFPGFTVKDFRRDGDKYLALLEVPE